MNSFSNKTIEALKMAIEALESIELLCDDKRWYLIGSARKACKEALAEAESESSSQPVAWMNDKTPSGIFARHKEGANNFGCDIPLYTHPATWQSLNADEIDDLWDESSKDVSGSIRLGYTTKQHYFYVLIEQALKEKNKC